MNKLSKFINNPWIAYVFAAGYGLTNWVPDEPHLKAMFRGTVGEKLDLKNPKTFNEKLQWLKLHDKNPLYNTLVDKYRVKPWVAERIGVEHVTKTYAMWEEVEDIDITDLPDRFVLKTNHDCGGVAICSDRSTFDLDAAKKKMAKHLKTNYFWRTREWPYKDVKPCVFAEEYLDPSEGKSDLTDYKIMCFDGKACCEFTCTDRSEGDLRVDFFDPEWNHLPFTRHYPNADIPPKAPASLKQMVSDAELLSKEIPFVRADFYEVAGQYYFGELTFFPGGGFEEFDPSLWDEKLGSWIQLPDSIGGGFFQNETTILWVHGIVKRDNSPADYKVSCFNGVPKLIEVHRGRFSNHTCDYFTPSWDSLPDLEWGDIPKSNYKIPAPSRLNEMLNYSSVLTEGFPEMRADWYLAGDRLIFGELTLFNDGGFGAIDDADDSLLGSFIDLDLAFGKK